MTLQTVGALTAEDLSAIQSSSHLFAEHMLARDFEALVTLYTHDVVLMPPGHPAVEGHDAVLALLESFPRASTFSLSISDIGGYGDVAYVRKVLPQAFTDDPDRLARFEREAKVLASLNHPNIGHIYGLEESEGQKALVLELVEGPTLADRIA